MLKLTTYTKGQYRNLKAELEAKGYAVISATELSSTQKDGKLSEFKLICLDVSSLLPLYDQSTGNDSTAALLELFCFQLPENTVFICNENTAERYQYDARTLFDAFERTTVANDVPDNIPTSPQKSKRLIDLTEEKMLSLLDAFDESLIGQGRFKAELRKQLAIFKLFNSIGEQPILSMLLLGPSGVGKTETARILSERLAPGQPLPKINFGNYSSKDSLNSLVGSPRGYIGSEEGELSMRIAGSPSGIILIDEFEKADPAIWNFFLDLLETGSYTDSQGTTHDLNGYAIVFTTNVDKSKIASTFPAELLSRFNLKVRLEPPSIVERREFVSRYVRATLLKLQESGRFTTLPTETIVESTLSNIDIENIDNLRILKNQARKCLAECIKEATRPLSRANSHFECTD